MDRLLTTGLLVAAGLFAAFPAAAAGDAAKGKTVFASQCAICHSAARNGPTVLGPSLFGVVGRPAASVKGFAYTPAMKAAGFTWTADKLRTYLPAPNKTVPGTRMTYAGLKDSTKVDDLIAYLSSLK
ncbi:MAG: c-type cytochrome [Phenylobacterium sp.]